MYRAKLSQLFTLFFNEIGIRNSWIWRLNVCEKSESHEKAANVLFCWQRWWFLEEGGSCSQTEEGLLKTWNWITIVRKSISLNLWMRTRTKCYSISLTRWTFCFMFCNSLTQRLCIHTISPGPYNKIQAIVQDSWLLLSPPWKAFLSKSLCIECIMCMYVLVSYKV